MTRTWPRHDRDMTGKRSIMIHSISPRSLRPSHLCQKVRLILGLHPEVISDRTIRRWRSQAFVKRKPFYTLDDAQQIADYAVLLIKLGNVQAAREQFAEILDERNKENGVGLDMELKTTLRLNCF